MSWDEYNLFNIPDDIGMFFLRRRRKREEAKEDKFEEIFKELKGREVRREEGAVAERDEIDDIADFDINQNKSCTQMRRDIIILAKRIRDLEEAMSDILKGDDGVRIKIEEDEG